MKKRILAGSLIVLSVAFAISFVRPRSEAPPNSLSNEQAISADGSDTVLGSITSEMVAASNDAAETGTETRSNPGKNAIPIRDMSSLSEQKVFRLILEDGECRLDAIENVTGDFRPRRGSVDVHAGMISCRLVGPNDAVLAEEIVHAPDHVCAVIDPNVSSDGPKVSLLAGIGPQVFQVRFPVSLAGEKLEVHRITQTIPEITRTLLLSVPLNP